MGTRANCSCPDICPAARSEPQPADEWSNTLGNLTSFLSASADLVLDLKMTLQAMEAFNVSPPEEKVQNAAKTPSKDDNCICAPSPCNGTPKAAAQKGTKDPAKDNCICAPSPCGGTPKATAQKVATKDNCICAPSPCNGIPKPMAQKAATKDNCICAPAPCNRTPKIGDTVSKPVLKCETPSAATIVLEPQYESCHEELAEPKEEPKKQSKTKMSKKQKYEQYAKEKTEKLTNLKQSINVAQKNLLDVQEQLRQLERLFQDYNSANTPEGQPNPAALFKEIMKPQSVPYIKPTPPPAPACPCDSCQDSTIRASRTPGRMEQKSVKKMSVPENVSVLSAVPLNDAFI